MLTLIGLGAGDADTLSRGAERALRTDFVFELRVGRTGFDVRNSVRGRVVADQQRVALRVIARAFGLRVR